jgi:regulatory protein
VTEPEKPRRTPSKSALQHAVGLLSARPYSERKLQEKLRRRDYEPDEIRAALERLKKERLLDDLKFAEDFVRVRLASRPRAATALIRDLLARGISMDVARKIVDAATSVADEESIARQLVERKAAQYDQLESHVRWRRLGGLLARRGFSPDIIRKVLARKQDD